MSKKAQSPQNSLNDEKSNTQEAKELKKDEDTQQQRQDGLSINIESGDAENQDQQDVEQTPQNIAADSNCQTNILHDTNQFNNGFNGQEEQDDDDDDDDEQADETDEKGEDEDDQKQWQQEEGKQQDNGPMSIGQFNRQRRYKMDQSNKDGDNCSQDNDDVDNQDQNQHFYKEYCRLYYANIILTNRLQQLLDEKQDLGYKLNRLESNKRSHEIVLNMPFEIDNEKKKRNRRTATEIARHYKCPIEDCPKSYGSEGSLNQHIKLKHHEYYNDVILQSNQNQSIAQLVDMNGEWQ